ncbi:Nucleosome assembly protein 1-like 4 [Thelohanellus kitauei]|uniref:Nucleosome assembly protein 1-like 4 n=1 Tax=Thelohanellus kitauei TaxID=669202 RepID=A0A0C2IGC0_THEKT|nr:Nucleosome assembly protein 1-like 4 [Thelohanellus kitauei]
MLACPPNTPIINSIVDDTEIIYETSKGFKNFWLKILQKNRASIDMISSIDIPVLEYLRDVKVKQVDPDAPFPDYPQFTDRGLILEFHFDKNPYFSNPVLFKYYQLGFPFREDDPFKYDGLLPVKIESCQINWHQGKNITVKTIKKTQKNKHTKQPRVVSKTEKVPSFFNFFSKIEASEINVESDYDEETIFNNLMFSEYHLASHIHSEIIPKAILYYLEEIEDDDDETELFDEHDDGSSSDTSPPPRRSEGFLS